MSTFLELIREMSGPVAAKCSTVYYKNNIMREVNLNQNSETVGQTAKQQGEIHCTI